MAIPKKQLYETLSTPTKTVAMRKVVIDVDGNIFIMTNDTNVPQNITVDREWTCMDRFLEINKQTALAYHEQFFGVEPPKKQDIELTKTWCWAHMVKEGKPIMKIQTVPDSVALGYRKSLATRTYECLWDPSKPLGINIPQAQTCMRFLYNATRPSGKISEMDFRVYVEQHAAELHTKQDPWRIFQYYRPRLNELHLLRSI